MSRSKLLRALVALGFVFAMATAFAGSTAAQDDDFNNDNDTGQTSTGGTATTGDTTGGNGGTVTGGAAYGGAAYGGDAEAEGGDASADAINDNEPDQDVELLRLAGQERERVRAAQSTLD